MFSWPYISIPPCNENQLDALFIFSLFLQSSSTCFGHICSTSSGVYSCYIYNSWYLFCFSVDSLLANIQSTEKHNTYQLLYIYSILPDVGLQIRPKHVEVDWRNKESIQLVFITRLGIRMLTWQWIIHALRRGDEVIEKQALDGWPKGARVRGRPKKTWKRIVLEETGKCSKTWS